MNDTKLPAEVEAKLTEMANDLYRTFGDTTSRSPLGWKETSYWKDCYKRLSAAAVVAVEHWEADPLVSCPYCEHGVIRWPSEDGGSPDMECPCCEGKGKKRSKALLDRIFQKQKEELDKAGDAYRKLQAELAQLRRPFTPTTRAEAIEVIHAWQAQMNHIPALEAAAAEIDKLIAQKMPGQAAFEKAAEIESEMGLGMTGKPQPVASGMTVEEHLEAAFDEGMVENGPPLKSTVRNHMEQAVAEAVGRQMEVTKHWQDEARVERERHAYELSRLRPGLGVEEAIAITEQRHAKELQEAVAAEREKGFKDSREWRNEISDLDKRHAAELAEIKENDFKALQRAVAIERQRQNETRAATLEEADKWIAEIRDVYDLDKDVLEYWKQLRQLAAAEKPEPICPISGYAGPGAVMAHLLEPDDTRPSARSTENARWP